MPTNDNDNYTDAYSGELLAGYVERVVEIARQEGLGEQFVRDKLFVEGMLLAAQLHRGNVESFLALAQKAIGDVAAGIVRQ